MKILRYPTDFVSHSIELEGTPEEFQDYLKTHIMNTAEHNGGRYDSWEIADMMVDPTSKMHAHFLIIHGIRVTFFEKLGDRK